MILVVLWITFPTTQQTDPLTETVRYLVKAPSIVYSSFQSHYVIPHPSAHTLDHDRIVEVSGYYNSVAYRTDMLEWEKLAKKAGGVSFPTDCYELSSATVNQLHYEDRLKIASNLFQKVLPNLTYFATHNKHSELAAIELFFLHIMINNQGSDGSRYLIPTYENKLVSIQYASSFDPGTRTPLTFFTPSIVRSYLEGKSPVHEFQLPSSEYELESFLVKENLPKKYHYAFRALYGYLETHPIPVSDSVDIPSDQLASVLSGLLLPYFLVFAKMYPGTHCS